MEAVRLAGIVVPRARSFRFRQFQPMSRIRRDRVDATRNNRSNLASRDAVGDPSAVTRFVSFAPKSLAFAMRAG
ncbi:MAG TPA: hypothetical protein DD670_03125 [Planctomycetaceae bacterium]|nr:hypothetical protein [Planctomycetaceae bacterium]